MDIKLASIDDAECLSRYYQDNHNHLAPWEPERERGYHHVTQWKERLVQLERECAEGESAFFVGYVHEPRELIATCSLTGITRGAFQACFMGYSIASAYEGKGYMHRLCSHAISYAFDNLNLNRVMANYMPRNKRSEDLLKRLGFEKEGFAEKYLFINGQWEDHVLTSLLNPRKRR